MPQFAYSAIEVGTGREQQGMVDCASPVLAAAELKNRGLAPVALTSQTSKLSDQRGAEPDAKPAEVSGLSRLAAMMARGISRKSLTHFTRQLAALLRAGLPLLRALEVLARPERNPKFKAIVTALGDAIRGGGNLTDGLRRFPRVFDELYLAMVRAGEASGALDLVLDRLARFRERAERVQGRVKAAMTYPVIIMVVAGAILTGLMVFVVPKFQLIFSSVLKGQPLPPLTRLVIGMGEIVHHHFAVILGSVVILWAGARCVRRSGRGSRLLDWLLIRSPGLGDLLLKAAIARITRTLGSLLASGVPILDALLITRAAIGNVHITEALTGVHDRVREGGTVARALENAAIFPGLVTSMIEVGEETGALPEMLGRVADTYDEEVDHAVGALTTIIEPVMIVVMALVVGVIVLALFLPIMGIVQHLQ